MATEKIWVESPEGKREQHTPINARDLINNAGWTVVGAKKAPAPAPAEPEDPSTNDDDKNDPNAGSADDDQNDGDDAQVGDQEDSDDDTPPDPNVQPVVRDDAGNLIANEGEGSTETSTTTEQTAPEKAPVDSIDEVHRAIAGLDKIGLEAYAKTTFGIDLDRRKSEAKLRAEIIGHAEAARTTI